MARRRFRTKGFRRKPRVHWVDTFQDGTPILIDCFPTSDSNPANNKVLVVPIIRQRTPQQVEDLSSVLEGKDEGFRLRRIVGNLIFYAGAFYASRTEDQARLTRVYFTIRWGLMVHPITANRNFDNLSTGGEYQFAPMQSVSMSDAWLLTGGCSLYNYGPFDDPTQDGSYHPSLRDDNQHHSPNGAFIDCTVNRRIKNEEDVSLFISWNLTMTPKVNDVIFEPQYQSNLRLLCSR